jgi:hypothetical protein
MPEEKWTKKYFFDLERKPIERKIVPELKKKYEYYHTEDNSGTPFIVHISPDKKDVSVYTIPTKEEYLFEDDYIYFKPSEGFPPDNLLLYTKRLGKFRPKRVFIGASPKNSMTLFSGGHGNDFYGNTILLQVTNSEYIYIQSSIERFKVLAPIVKFVSPVGNNNVPYPFAVDEDGNYYLLAFSIIIKDFPENYIYSPSDCECPPYVKEKAGKEPYQYYHEMKSSDEKIQKIEIVKDTPHESY